MKTLFDEYQRVFPHGETEYWVLMSRAEVEGIVALEISVELQARCRQALAELPRPDRAG